MLLAVDTIYQREATYRALNEHPEWLRPLQNMLAWEEQNPAQPSDPYSGWQWEDVATHPSMIGAMIVSELVKLSSKSRTYTNYRLRDASAVREALDMATPATAIDAPLNVDTLFELVIGHDNLKALCRSAVLAERPVHVLLIGPVGTAKTLMISDIGRLPGAEYYAGSNTTKAGLVGLLIAQRPRFLVLDELDKMPKEDMTPLLGLMETGTVTRLQHGHHDRVDLNTTVFASANELKPIPAPIQSRFAKARLQPYTAAEFVDVASRVLELREKMKPNMAKLVAIEVVKHSTDIRDAVRVARLCANGAEPDTGYVRGDPGRVKEIVAYLWPAVRPV